MRGFGRALGRGLAALILLGGLMWLFGPYEDTDLKAEFDPSRFGEGVQVYFETVEAQFEDITPGTQKRVIWAGSPETRTAVSVLYVHGFSATSQEIRPVPDRIAAALGANLVFTRLQGHGRPGAALGKATINGWMSDLAEALAAARAVGDRVVVVSTSTGATLVAAAALDPDLSEQVAAMIFVSPNFGINNGSAFLLTLPGARIWLPWLMGGERRVESNDPDESKYWTRSYPWSALAPLGALVAHVADLDFSGATTPALFWFSDSDRVVRADRTRQIAGRWGGPMTLITVEMGAGDDPDAHVITGDIRSPGQTDAAVSDMLDWLRKQEIE